MLVRGFVSLRFGEAVHNGGDGEADMDFSIEGLHTQTVAGQHRFCAVGLLVGRGRLEEPIWIESETRGVQGNDRL